MTYCEKITNDAVVTIAERCMPSCYIVMAYIVMAYIVMAYIVMAYIVMASPGSASEAITI